jgi:hypothetical protein
MNYYAYGNRVHVCKFSNGWIRVAWSDSGDPRSIDYRLKHVKEAVRNRAAGVFYTKDLEKVSAHLTSLVEHSPHFFTA